MTIAQTYHRNSRGVYSLPIWARPLFWVVSSWLIFGFVLLIGSVVALNWLMFSVALVLALGLTGWQANTFAKQMIKAKTLRKWLVERRAERDITQGLLATMTVNLLKSTPFISVPTVEVEDLRRRKKVVRVKIEKLPGMYDLERLSEDVSSCLSGELKDYLVTSAMVTRDKNCFILTLEDGRRKTWRPKKLKEMKQSSHVLKLQKGLSINLADRPGLIVWGKSGAGKTTTLISILVQALMWESPSNEPSKVFLIDPKNEFSALSEFYPSDMIATEVDEVLDVMRRVAAIIKERQKIVALGVRERQKMGLRAYDLGLSAVIVMIDEVGSLVASMDTKQKKEFLSMVTQLVQKGRSVSCFAVIGTQSAKADTTLPTDIRGQLSTKIVLGSASDEEYRMAFGQVPTKGGVERFEGYYLIDGIEQPLLFSVPDLHRHGLNELPKIEQAYKMEIRTKTIKSA